MFSYPLTAQCAFCFPALIRLFFLPPPVPQIISRLSVSPPSGLPFLSSATLFSHPGALMLTIISPLFSLLFCFSTLPLCPHHPSTPCPAIIRPPHGGLDCACVCLSLCFSSPHLFNVRLCVILPCLCISGLTEALSSHKPFQSATLSPRPHTHAYKHTTSAPLLVADSLLDLTCPNSRSWQGKCQPPHSLFSPNPPTFSILSWSFWLKPTPKTMSIVSGRLGGERSPLWWLFAGLCTYRYSQLHDSAGCENTGWTKRLAPWWQ